MWSKSFPFEVDICGSPITGTATAEYGRLVSIEFEDGTTVMSAWRSATAASHDDPVAESFFDAVAPDVTRQYAEEIEATSGWHYDARAAHRLGKHQLI